MKKSALFFLLVFNTLMSFSQCDFRAIHTRISNDSANFLIRKIGGSNIQNETIKLAQIKIDLVSPAIKDIGKCDSILFIRSLLPLLNDKSKDWCTVIFLYYLSGKDASQFVGISGKKEWRRLYKKRDIDFWSKYLAN